MIRAAAGDDVLIGNDGDDLLDGGTGNDTLTSGLGDDDMRDDSHAATPPRRHAATPPGPGPIVQCFQGEDSMDGGPDNDRIAVTGDGDGEVGDDADGGSGDDRIHRRGRRRPLRGRIGQRRDR